MTSRTKLEILNSRGGVDRMPRTYTGTPVDPNRRDTYAENLIGSGNYKDSGCNLAPSCLSCTYSECVKEFNSATHRVQRNAAIWQDYQVLKNRGTFPIIPALAAKYGLGTRTVQRVLASAKKAS